MIQINNVSKIYKGKKGTVTAVQNVSLTISAGEIFGMIGYSGAGKSTLLRMLNGLESPTSGEVIINGQSISKCSSSQLRKARQKIGMIFQHFNLLWSRTVLENILFPLEIAKVPKQESITRAKELVKLVGLEGRENAYPSELSGGQKQRVGIARALANNPDVLLCDEATSALDPETTDSILALLTNINKQLGITIILITHEMHVIQKICQRVAVMENGQVVEEGHVVDVFTRPKQSITKKFVKQIKGTDEELDNEVISKSVGNDNTYKLTFKNGQADQPHISEVVKHFEIEVNILQGKIVQTAEGSYGTMKIQLVGDRNNIKEAISYLESKQVEVEVA
ncbi:MULTISPECIES: methionine ABC transporter ATP-binding protein [unclassified Bacillus (in: firmicutes)]|uniref:methionine ABC transporter ATP-binding protein n=1 Tax=unclassified Bacillus (in: firmicutes) TaxID=185979 RepID=UPI000BF14951|nr:MULTISPECIES: ATP-binding cassette domain-containing protein [unclassified Bacillus (in: firmicutes)]PEJ58188.1 methionine ABC transporter ATP-binding protein [Bacillus sp. AFS002410]PEL12063.1 methionine ABC transporter ATP-binding protein [Bacillus sp. AFS017336]